LQTKVWRQALDTRGGDFKGAEVEERCCGGEGSESVSREVEGSDVVSGLPVDFYR